VGILTLISGFLLGWRLRGKARTDLGKFGGADGVV
jgi:hypothetical protein